MVKIHSSYGNITAPKYSFFNEKLKWPKLFIVNFLDFCGPDEMRGNDFEENKVVPSIFM